MQIVNAPYLSAAWREYRRSRVTGSTAAAILGQSTYSSPLSEWARILGRSVDRDESNPYGEWGQATEAAHRLWIEHDGEGHVWTVEGIVQHPRMHWACCTPDGFMGTEGAPDFAVVELKAPSSWTADEWRGDLPLKHQVQSQFNGSVCGAPASYLSAILPPERDPMGAFVRVAAALFDADSARDRLDLLRWAGFTRVGFRLPAHERFRSAMFAALAKFWTENVEQGFAPDATGLACDKETLKGLGGEELATDFDEQAVALWTELQAVNAEMKKLDDRKETIQNRLTQAARASTWKDAKRAITQARKITA